MGPGARKGAQEQRSRGAMEYNVLEIIQNEKSRKVGLERVKVAKEITSST